MFTLILGPMKSGKSLELIARVAPYEFAERKVLYIQPISNVRDNGVKSRLGLNTDAIKFASLDQVKNGFDVIGIDEVHMFKPTEAKIIEIWVKQGKDIFISGLDLDYRGIMPPIIKNLFQLKPDQIIYKVAVCDTCKKYDAQFTQILNSGKPVTKGLPLISPEDGTYEYQARCRSCFVKI